ncbi:MAG: hypothetical protein AB1659_13835, partial [Thermodesulfobacteriota bacterium]
LGILHFKTVKAGSAKVISTSSHHVTGWLAKHGKRDKPGCHFARGWIAGALEAIYQKPLGYYTVKENRCKMIRDTECSFTVERMRVNS